MPIPRYRLTDHITMREMAFHLGMCEPGGDVSKANVRSARRMLRTLEESRGVELVFQRKGGGKAYTTMRALMAGAPELVETDEVLVEHVRETVQEMRDQIDVYASAVEQLAKEVSAISKRLAKLDQSGAKGSQSERPIQYRDPS